MDIALTNRLNVMPTPVSTGKALRAYTPPQSQQQSSTATPANDDVSIIPSRSRESGTRLVSENKQDLPDGGYRRSRTYEREDGRTFTKIEELSLTERGARRSVVQQNPSGSLTMYEEVLDREDGGNFRRTQRFQEANGEVSTNITTDYQVTDPFVLTGGYTPYSSTQYLPFDPSRGTQLDIRV